MKKLLVGIVASVVLSVGSMLGLVHYMPKASENLDQLRFSTWQIQMGEFGSCSGVLVAPNKLLTAAHCDVGLPMKVAGAKATVLRKDEKNDLMLLYVVPTQGAAKVATRLPQVDSKVAVVGFPLGGPEFITEGRVQALLKDKMIFSAQVIMGNSGGPVFVKEDGEWKVAGIVSGIPVVPLFGIIPFLVTHMPIGANADSINKLLSE